jgi:hypothetical protein
MVRAEVCSIDNRRVGQICAPAGRIHCRRIKYLEQLREHLALDAALATGYT